MGNMAHQREGYTLHWSKGDIVKVRLKTTDDSALSLDHCVPWISYFHCGSSDMGNYGRAYSER